MGESFWQGITPQTVADAPSGFKEFDIGDNVAFISQVNQKVSKSGNKMLEIIFKKEDDAEIRYYIVDDEYKMQKLKSLYTSFGIPMANKEIDGWKGKKGIVVCKKGEPYGDKGICYNKVAYLKPLENGHNSPSAPTNPNSDGFTDDIPF